MYHDQTVNWFKEHDLKFIVNPVYSPAYFRSNALPEKLKQQIIQQLSPNVQQLIAVHSQQDDLNFEIFKKEIAKQDRWKNIQLKHYLPELAKAIDQ